MCEGPQGFPATSFYLLVRSSKICLAPEGSRVWKWILQNDKLGVGVKVSLRLCRRKLRCFQRPATWPPVVVVVNCPPDGVREDHGYQPFGICASRGIQHHYRVVDIKIQNQVRLLIHRPWCVISRCMQHFQESVIINSPLSVRIQVADDLAGFGMGHLGLGQWQLTASGTTSPQA